MVRLTDRVKRGSLIYGPQRYVVSRWGFVFGFENHAALYHALRISIVLLTKQEYDFFVASYQNGVHINDSVDWIEELIDAHILLGDLGKDDRTLEELRANIPLPCISIMQMILADTCNLACTYCFIGRNESEFAPTRQGGEHLMSEKVADLAVDYFEAQANCMTERESSPKDIIFYGGEPLLNFAVLKHVVSRIRSDQSDGKISRDLTFAVITNGTLLTPEMASFFKREKVLLSLSLDGVGADANACRVDREGCSAYDRILAAVHLASHYELDFGLSVTLTERTLLQGEKLVMFLKDHRIHGVSFNILLGKTSEMYSEKAAQFIVNFYRSARQLGIKEDRMLRKIKAFSQRRFYYHDCAALSGNQIVVMPNGDVGICQGLIGEEHFKITDVSNKSEIFAEKKEIWEWRSKTPINNTSCWDCPAIGICGGGCPINARNAFGSRSEIDERFCVHTKVALAFLVKDLCENMLGNGTKL